MVGWVKVEGRLPDGFTVSDKKVAGLNDTGIWVKNNDTIKSDWYFAGYGWTSVNTRLVDCKLIATKDGKKYVWEEGKAFVEDVVPVRPPPPPQPTIVQKTSSCDKKRTWGIDKDGGIYRILPDKFIKIPGELKKGIAATNAELWGVNSESKIFKKPTTNTNSDWKLVDGALDKIYVDCSKNLVWGTRGDNIWERINGKWVQKDVDDDFEDEDPDEGTGNNVKTWGAKGDGKTDDTEAFKRILTSSLKEVFIPAGTYITNGLTIPSGKIIKGDGKTKSIIKLKNNYGYGLLSINNIRNTTITDLTLDSNRDGGTNGHTIRISGCDNVTIKNCNIKNGRTYNIGAQVGIVKDLTIDNCVLEGSGHDGIDIKNKESKNSGIIIRNVTVNSFGVGNTGESYPAGIDLRSKCVVESVVVNGIDASNKHGIRFRQGETTDIHGSGGHGSTLTKFHL